jgi:hypothetical protein
MKRYTTPTCHSIVLIICLGLAACNSTSGDKLYGTWQGKTRIEQDITMMIRPDSTIEISTMVDDTIRQIRKGTFTLVDRRLRISLTSLDTYSGESVKHESKIDQDEALVTFTSADEIVLRKGTQAMVLERAKEK